MDSFSTRTTASLAGHNVEFWDLSVLAQAGHDIARLPYTIRVLLENALRNEDGKKVRAQDVTAILEWNPGSEPNSEIAFCPARVLLQDFTGVPCVVDLASMRDAMAALGGDPAKINPLQPAELVIDHSVQVDAFGTPEALGTNLRFEFERNNERYEFLKWGQSAFDNFKVVPPNTGICHQVNLEYLARVVFHDQSAQGARAYPDTLVGTDSHTTMINALGVLGWGVGGIEAEAAMLGQPVSMLLPQVVGFRLTGRLAPGTTATDLVLTVTEMLRAHGVVGKFVEFFGPAMEHMPLADRATIANMAPEYGATCGFFPIDAETLRYLRTSGRDDDHVALVEAYARRQSLFFTPESPTPEYSSVLALDLGDVVPSVAGPKRPQDRVSLDRAGASFRDVFPRSGTSNILEKARTDALVDGSIVIAAITSCTNTSNPTVMVAAGLVARNARALGLLPKPWVKTSLAPGSRVVTAYLREAGLLEDLEAIGFDVVGYGCTTCIGNSGPLPEDVLEVVRAGELSVVSVLSGNRNFEGRVNSDVKANYLMSPPLVVAYALAGHIEVDLTSEPLGVSLEGKPVFLRDIWPNEAEVAKAVEGCVTRELFVGSYATLFDGDEKWRAIAVEPSERYSWVEDSTYVRPAPFFDGLTAEPPATVAPLLGLRVLAVLGDSVTTDHISPAGAIKPGSPAGEYLASHGVPIAMFNSYGSRRGNHEVMIRGTFANVRLRNRLAPGTEGGFTTNVNTNEVTTVFDAAQAYAETGTPLMVIAGKEYGTGSSRDWAAKGTMLLGVRAVLAESFERIHRSNLVGMGVLPIQFLPGDSAASLGLTGHETYEIVDFSERFSTGFAEVKHVKVRAITDNITKEFSTLVRIDTPTEREYYRHGGVLQFVLRQLAQ